MNEILAKCVYTDKLIQLIINLLINILNQKNAVELYINVTFSE